jgi:hypothetical protein
MGSQTQPALSFSTGSANLERSSAEQSVWHTSRIHSSLQSSLRSQQCAARRLRHPPSPLLHHLGTHSQSDAIGKLAEGRLLLSDVLKGQISIHECNIHHSLQQSELPALNFPSALDGQKTLSILIVNMNAISCSEVLANEQRLRDSYLAALYNATRTQIRSLLDPLSDCCCTIAISNPFFWDFFGAFPLFQPGSFHARANIRPVPTPRCTVFVSPRAEAAVN